MIRVAEWNERYEVTTKGAEARPGDELRAGPLRYIRNKVHGYHLGPGMRTLKQLAGLRAMEVYGIFQKCLEIAGAHRKGQRGQLLNHHGNPATEHDLAFIFDVPIEQIEHALAILVDPKLGWLTTQPNPTQLNNNTTQGPRNFPELPGNPGPLEEKPVVVESNSGEETPSLARHLAHIKQHNVNLASQPSTEAELALLIQKWPSESISKVIGDFAKVAGNVKLLEYHLASGYQTIAQVQAGKDKVRAEMKRRHDELEQQKKDALPLDMVKAGAREWLDKHQKPDCRNI